MIPMETVYTDGFYRPRNSQTEYAANHVISVLLERFLEINSAIDIGCGVGTWLKVFKEKTGGNVLGVEGSWLDNSLLEIKEDEFFERDLKEPFYFENKFDLAISLEVAEHLPNEVSDQFVHCLSNLADVILFSAAIPGQKGTHHINCQWQTFWVKKFSENGFVLLDFIRPRIWNDVNIPIHYKQNILVFYRSDEEVTINGITDLVHPESYLAATNIDIGIRDSLLILMHNLKKFFTRVK